jgi:ABC-type ATPase with predicted acetyltransferase domain
MVMPGAGEILLIVGASGSGKSSLLRHYRAKFQGDLIDLDRLRLPGCAIVDAFPSLSLEETLHLLSRVGLAEAHSYLLPPSKLSAGQRWRLRLAVGMEEVRRTRMSPPAALLVDEFAAVLDRVTAAVIARLLRRWVSSAGNCRAIVATSHDDLMAALRPDWVVRCDFGEMKVERRHTS